MPIIIVLGYKDIIIKQFMKFQRTINNKILLKQFKQFGSVGFDYILITIIMMIMIIMIVDWFIYKNDCIMKDVLFEYMVILLWCDVVGEDEFDDDDDNVWFTLWSFNSFDKVETIIIFNCSSSIFIKDLQNFCMIFNNDSLFLTDLSKIKDTLLEEVD